MTMSTTPNAAANADRETDRRFYKDAIASPCNPFARKTAALREALIDAVTPKDILDIATILTFNAKAGHFPSIKLLFQYVIGKPKPAVEPDTLDLEELNLLQASQMPSEALKEFTNKFPPALALDTLRGLRTAIDLQLRQMLAETEPPADEEPEAPAKSADSEQFRAQAPTANGENEDDYDEEELDSDDETPSHNSAFQALKELKSILPPFKNGRRG